MSTPSSPDNIQLTQSIALSIMQFTDSFATEQRISVLDCIEFCQQCTEGMIYRPDYHRPNSDLVDHAAQYLHQLMHYSDHNPEY